MSNAQTTAPQPTRTALKLKAGNELVDEIRGDEVVLTKTCQVAEGDDPFRAFGEWNPAPDREAYGDL